jgi:hypothetical protein
MLRSKSLLAKISSCAPARAFGVKLDLRFSPISVAFPYPRWRQHTNVAFLVAVVAQLLPSHGYGLSACSLTPWRRLHLRSRCLSDSWLQQCTSRVAVVQTIKTQWIAYIRLDGQ